MDRRNPYVFVVGCPRSGTTLLQRMLDGHPLLAVANDTHFIPKPLGGRAVDPPLTESLVSQVRDYRRFKRLELPDEAVRRAAAGAATYSAFVGALYSEYGTLRGKPLAGEKTPDYVRKLDVLNALFPWARVIHIVRDGRDVALSAFEWATGDKGPAHFELWERDPVAVCALWWRWMVTSGRRDGRTLGSPRYMEVRYEDLVTDAEGALMRISAFLDLDFAPAMVAFHEGRTRREPGLSAKNAWLPVTAGLRDWRTDLSRRDLELFEALAGTTLESFGFERACTSISVDVASAADAYERWWVEEMERRRVRKLQEAGLT